jgi:hypothetical protein
VQFGRSLEFSEYSENDIIVDALKPLQSLSKQRGPDENASGPTWRRFAGENKHNFEAYFLLQSAST